MINSGHPAFRQKLHRFFSFSSNSVFYRMTMAFGLFFLCPLVGLIFLSVKTQLFGTDELFYCLIGLLVSTLFGYIIMRQISDGIARVEHRMSSKIDGLDRGRRVGENELENISTFADLMSENIKAAGKSLNRRMSEIHALKELGGLSVFKVNARSLARISLERSVEVTEARGGAVILVTDRKGICFHRIGEGLKLTRNMAFSAEFLPWREAVHQNNPLWMRSSSCEHWLEYFDQECKTAVVIPFGRFGNTAAITILVAGMGDDWDDTTLAFLSTYFSTVGNMLKMVEIDIKKKETTNELKTVLTIIKILNSNPKEEDLLAIIAKKVEQIIPHHWIGLALKSTDKDDSLYLSHSFSKAGTDTGTGVPIDSKRSLFHLAMHNDEPIYMENLKRQGAFFEKHLFQKLNLKSCVIASLNSSGKARGVMCIGSEGVGGFGRREKRLFSLVTKGVSIALDQSRAFARERAKRAELEVLNKIGGVLSSHTIQANKVLPYVLDRITDLVEVDVGCIMLMEFDGLIVEAAVGKFSKELLQQKFKLSHGAAGYVVATGEAVIVDNVRENSHFVSIVDEKTGFETRSMLCVPMISGGRIIGVIELLNRIGRPFSEEDMQAVRAVAASVAIALENTRLYSESSHIAKKEKFIRKIFQKYVPEKIVSDMLQHGEPDRMIVGQKRTVTVFNVDIRGYTTMSKQASAEDVVHILNHFFRRMGYIILQHKGLVDKYLGDGLLAIFGAPVSTANPALDAVLAAKDMIRAIEHVSILSIDRCGVPIKIGISVNTGEAIVGNIGFSKKMEYTVIGGVVNEVFRIQDLTRVKENSILIGETTYEQIKSDVKTKHYGLKKLDSSLVNIYEVLTDESQGSGIRTAVSGDKVVNIR